MPVLSPICQIVINAMDDDTHNKKVKHIMMTNNMNQSELEDNSGSCSVPHQKESRHIPSPQHEGPLRNVYVNSRTARAGSRSALLIASSLMFAGTHGMVLQSAPRLHRSTESLRISTSSEGGARDLLLSAQTLRNFRSRESMKPSQRHEAEYSFVSSWTDALFTEEEFDSENASAQLESEILSRVRSEVDNLTELRTATGSEVSDSELHLQMEAARKRATRSVLSTTVGSTYDAVVSAAMTKYEFIKGHVSDATGQETVAMSSVPLQLPSPADGVPIRDLESTRISVRRSRVIQKKIGRVSAVHSRHERDMQSVSALDATGSSKVGTRRTTQRSELDWGSARVTPEEEIELARIIQKGVQLHKIKTDFENQNGRDISRQEWTEKADLKSPRELRRLVSDYRTAKQKLVTANMGLVHAVVKSASCHHKRRMGISQEELVQEGSLGLIRAAELFDPARGLRFSTYATIWIKGMLSNSSVDQLVTLPAREKSKWNKIRQAEADIMKERGGNDQSKRATEEEIAERTSLKIQDVVQTRQKMISACNVLSLDYQYQSQSRSGAETGQVQSAQLDKAFMADADLAERLQLRADVIAALVRNLDPREARLMRLRYGLKDGRTRTISECAEAMGITRSRTQELSSQCLKKLREADDAESLQEYLLTIA